ncbi:Uncharacterized protein ImpI/VasC [Nitrincola lacisaponensis]|uniref:Uncharacterized protein ImpI/VasC n=1 Tax=Nitrincola lacisaponensis TaxID=267850 RepID=A0A063Y807_9GAMM|nr:type VI secretion system-associated FHA domain protein TagH [Nitrincola lacisaponensis]KDE40876.1 Uncharacterized protein ImpI/VasC [Nitrincola lacisaponensis]
MLMELRVISEQQSQLKDRCSIQLEGELLSIGRGADNHWVLPDENLHLSGKHCIVSRKNDSFIITDLSTNGVFMDSQETPLGRGRSAVLKHGSLIRIGDYRISVSIDQHTGAPAYAGDALQVDAVAAGGLAAALADTSSPAVPVYSKTTDDHLSPERASLSAPLPKPLPDTQQPVLPDDWFLTMDAVTAEAAFDPLAETVPEPDFISESVPEPDPVPEFDPAPVRMERHLDVTEELVRSAEPAPEPGQVEEAVVICQPVARSMPDVPVSETVKAGSGTGGSVLSDTELLHRILQAADLDPARVREAPFLADRLGVLLKTFANGMIQTLATRSLVKGEFRLQQTMIQPTDNNPFKFSPTGREALNIVLFSESQAYQSGEKAIEESFADIQAHQLAMMSGVQEALFKLLNRLDPETLEQQFQRKPRHLSGMPGMKKVNCWEEYKDFYEALKASMSDDLQGFFIKEFGMAYEDQLKKLKHDA